MIKLLFDECSFSIFRASRPTRYGLRFKNAMEGRIFFEHHPFSYKQVPRFLQLERQYHRYDNNLCAAQMMSYCYYYLLKNNFADQYTILLMKK
ncbi:hypothetical protein BpHYR1_040882 [Brachionus plicatilis]|uniref:Uncharacterized protein n=1 Tax=Brachionus plicatilis TaxID=10195 RepID=A0A3M7T7S8_BRAPC|nr:hypothetical protein BpHYR1_040882 [Brachionus plicatilis]